MELQDGTTKRMYTGATMRDILAYFGIKAEPEAIIVTKAPNGATLSIEDENSNYLYWDEILNRALPAPKQSRRHPVDTLLRQ